ncbi:uncharacterized protein LOC105845988 [Hydra vulgaris]|uniref:uncharacterized protein LOC105845988 n=1 Tax=Hydra vulgaris TaxID=6087 RepID=UPI001F5F36EA|nr:suppressor protein SRP40-like [Hydra vulgaris]
MKKGLFEHVDGLVALRTTTLSSSSSSPSTSSSSDKDTKSLSSGSASSSTDVSVSDKYALPATAKKQKMVVSEQEKNHSESPTIPRTFAAEGVREADDNLVIEHAASDKDEESESKFETSSSSISSDEDDEPFNDDELPAKEAAVIQAHAAFTNNLCSNYVENEIADNDAAFDAEKDVFSPDDLHNLKSVMGLEIEERMKNITAKNPKKVIVWDILLKHIASHLDTIKNNSCTSNVVKLEA